MALSFLRSYFFARPAHLLYTLRLRSLLVGIQIRAADETATIQRGERQPKPPATEKQMLDKPISMGVLYHRKTGSANNSIFFDQN